MSSLQLSYLVMVLKASLDLATYATTGIALQLSYFRIWNIVYHRTTKNTTTSSWWSAWESNSEGLCQPVYSRSPLPTGLTLQIFKLEKWSDFGFLFRHLIIYLRSVWGRFCSNSLRRDIIISILPMFIISLIRNLLFHDLVFILYHPQGGLYTFIFLFILCGTGATWTHDLLLIRQTF